jgi:hypothetical protein
MPALLPGPGQVVELADEDYRYGDGRITFYVASLGERTIENGAPRIALTGHRLVRGEQWGPEHTITARVSGIMRQAVAGEPLPQKPR